LLLLFPKFIKQHSDVKTFIQDFQAMRSMVARMANKQTENAEARQQQELNGGEDNANTSKGRSKAAAAAAASSSKSNGPLGIDTDEVMGNRAIRRAQKKGKKGKGSPARGFASMMNNS
jgi:cobalamin biosynthesis Mg chelatase CobN